MTPSFPVRFIWTSSLQRLSLPPLADLGEIDLIGGVGIHQSPVNSPPKGQWREALMFSLICAWINGWENIRKAGDLRRHRCHYDVTVMFDDAF